MKRETRENLLGGVMFLGFFLILGIVGNVECGGSLWQMLWCMPIIGVMGIVGFWMELENERELRRYEIMKKRRCEKNEQISYTVER